MLNPALECRDSPRNAGKHSTGFRTEFRDARTESYTACPYFLQRTAEAFLFKLIVEKPGESGAELGWKMSETFSDRINSHD